MLADRAGLRLRAEASTRALGTGFEYAVGEEAKQHSQEAEVARRTAVAASLTITAHLLTQDALEVRRTNALLVLGTSRTIQTEEKLIIADVR